MTEFKPCPICGRRLTWDDTIFADECGEICSEDSANYVVMTCSCGYNLSIDVFEVNCLLDGWQEKFVRIANRRWTSPMSKEEFDKRADYQKMEQEGKKMNLKELDSSELTQLADTFMKEVHPNHDSMFVWEHDEKTYVVAYFESCIYNLMEVIE